MPKYPGQIKQQSMANKALVASKYYPSVAERRQEAKEAIRHEKLLQNQQINKYAVHENKQRLAKIDMRLNLEANYKLPALDKKLNNLDHNGPLY